MHSTQSGSAPAARKATAGRAAACLRPASHASTCLHAQGKSYILNQLLGQSSGFTVGPTHRPCTKGLWMWSTPVERRAPDGSKYHLVRAPLQCSLFSHSLWRMLPDDRWEKHPSSVVT
jgi:hypothetical protein